MIRLQDQLLSLGTYTLLGLLALAVVLAPVYWRFVPASRRREFHVLVSALVLIGFFRDQAPILFLAIGWVVLSVHRLRRWYAQGGGGAGPSSGSRSSPPANPAPSPSIVSVGAPDAWRASAASSTAAAAGSAVSPSQASAVAAPVSAAAAGRPVDSWIVFLHVLPLLAVFLLTKFNVLSLIGYSYLFLRALHLLIEAGRQRRFPAHVLDVAHYLFFLPSFFSGPIDRLTRFRETAASRLTREDATEGLYRLARGAVRKFVFAEAFHLWYEVLRQSLGELAGWQVWLLYNIFILYLFFDFSGYSDMAIGLGRLYGWRLCENFNVPFAARNLSQFWRSWHMSFTFWLQDYIFTPIARWFTGKMGGSAQTRVVLAMIPASICTMSACGVWHLIDVRMVVWGAAQGVVLMAGILYGEMMKKARLGEFHKRLGDMVPYRVFCSLLVIEFNCLALPLLIEKLPTAWSAAMVMLGLANKITI